MQREWCMWMMWVYSFIYICDGGANTAVTEITILESRVGGKGELNVNNMDQVPGAIRVIGGNAIEPGMPG